MIKNSILNTCSIILKGLQAKNAATTVPAGFIQLNLLSLLHREGIIDGYRFSNSMDVHNSAYFIVDLKYYSDKTPILRFIKRISTPGRRLGWTAKQIRKIEIPIGILIIISTNKGLKTLKECRIEGLGGEPLFKIL